ncbi:MAG: hypothetical protein H6669_20605 [Ardenticatenaceae bacterium]|nr:hypothetical protein [Ardenticatenaceae bacterium]
MRNITTPPIPTTTAAMAVAWVHEHQYVLSQKSIIAQNVDMSYGSYPYGYADCYGTYTSESHNPIGDQGKSRTTPHPPGRQLTGGSSDSVGGFGC